MQTNHKSWRVDGRVETQCEHCGAWFFNARITGFFCSSVCRVAHHRATKAREKDIERLVQCLHKVIAAMPRKGDSHEFIALQSAETLIKTALRGVES